MALTDEPIPLERAYWLSDDRQRLYAGGLTPDALLVFGIGVLDRDATVGSMAAAPAWRSVELDDVRAIELRDGAALLVYRARATRDGGVPYDAYASSVYVADGGGHWRLAFHQQTPVAGAGA